MDRKTLVRAAKSAGWTGKTLDSLKEWAESEGIGEFRVGKDAVPFDKIEDVWAKTVTISVAADSGEDVVVNDGSAQTEEMDEDEDLEAKSEDEAEDEDRKQFEAFKKFNRERAQKSADTVRKINRANANAVNKANGRIGDRESAAKSAYDRAVKNNSRLRSTNKSAVFRDADQAEAVGAAIRMTVMGAHPYSQKSRDEEIVSKAGSTFNPATGGALVFGEYSPELIELFDQYGVARQAVGVTQMAEGEKTVPRLDSDITVYDIGENDAITASDEGYSNVTLNATKTGALKRMPSELLNDAAINVADVIARSAARAVGKWEDESYFLGQHNRTGINNLIGTNGTDVFDSDSGGWSGITISDIQTAIGLLPGWAHAAGISIVCSSAFYSTVLDTFAMSAGGNTGANLKSGFGGMTMWGQYPVFISEVCPSSYSDGQNVCYIGAFSEASKFGVVTGSEQFATSDQRYFDQDQFAVRYLQRWAINLHDIGGSGSGVVALQA